MEKIKKVISILLGMGVVCLPFVLAMLIYAFGFNAGQDRIVSMVNSSDDCTCKLELEDK